MKSYIIATRPWSFTMSILSVSVGALLAAESGPISWPWFAVTVVGIVIFHAAANVINDYFDTKYRIDQPDSPTAKYRQQPIISGLLSMRELYWEFVVLFGITSVIGVITAYFRTYHVLWIGLIGLLTSIFYTAGPVKFKYRALGELAVFMMWGPLMIEGAYAVQRHALSMKALYISIPFGTLVALVLFANNMRDIAYDSRRNVKTLSIMLGSEKSYILFAALIIAAYAYVLGMVLVGVLSWWGLLIFLALPKAFSLLKSLREKIPDASDAITAQFDAVFAVLLILAIVIETGVVHW